MMRRSFLPWLPLALLAVVLACSAPQYQLLEFLEGTPGRVGPDWCQSRNIDQATDAVLKRYLPQELIAHRWPGAEKGGPPLPEKEFFAALEGGRLRRTLLVAGAGLGKTRLADALDAELCATTPTLRLAVDAALVAAVRKAEGDPVLDGLERSLGIAAGTPRQADLRTMLAKARWVLVVDSLHDVPLADRPQFLTQIKTFLDKYPKNLQTIVLARPEDVHADLGLGDFDAVLSIPQLDCGRTAAMLRAATRTQEREQRLRTFAARYGLDAQVTTGGRCQYTHLSSYRGVKVLLAMAEARGLEGPDGVVKATAAARADVIEDYLRRMLQASLPGDVSGKPEARAAQVQAVVAAIDAMVARVPTEQLARPVLSQEACAVALNAAYPAAAGRPDVVAVCDAVARSGLVADDESGTATLTDPTLADWFRARRAIRNLAAPCTGLDAAALPSPTAAAFAAGAPTAVGCLADIAHAACSAGADPAALAAALDQGLGHGPARAQALAAAAAVPSASACVQAVIKGVPAR